MATRTFGLETTVAAEPAVVIDFMMDLSRHFGLHPYVVSAEPVSTGVDAEGSWTQWTVVERPPFGPFHYTIRFPARMRRTSDLTMVGTVRAAPGCTLITRTSARLVDGQTVLSETTTVSAPRLVVGYMASEAERAHSRTFSLLPIELAGASTD